MVQFEFSLFSLMMRWCRRVAPSLFACMSLALPLRAQTLPGDVAAAMAVAGVPSSGVSVYVQPLDGGVPLIAHNADRAVSPASVMKLLTTYAALDLLGPAHVWKTSVLSEKMPENGRLQGDLYLRGGGDPKFLVEHFWLLLRQLRGRGLQRIDGDLVMDRSAFGEPEIDPAAFDDKPMRPYNAGPDALLVNFRSLRFAVRPEAGGAKLHLETPVDGVLVENRLRLVNGRCPSAWKEGLHLTVSETNGAVRLEFSGDYGAQCGEKWLYLSVLSNRLLTEKMFRALWREMGGEFRGRVRLAATPATAHLLAERESPALSEIVRDINKYSNNVMARQLFLALAEDDHPLTTEKARRRLRSWLRNRGLNFPELEIENGSGLSRRARISAASIGWLLVDAWKSPVMPELVASLPIVGVDGTMQKRLRSSVVSGRAHIKTGSLEGVRSVAGYALGQTGRRHAIVVIINHPAAAAGQPIIDSILLWVAQQK